MTAGEVSSAWGNTHVSACIKIAKCSSAGALLRALGAFTCKPNPCYDLESSMVPERFPARQERTRSDKTDQSSCRCDSFIESRHSAVSKSKELWKRASVWRAQSNLTPTKWRFVPLLNRGAVLASNRSQFSPKKMLKQHRPSVSIEGRYWST